MNKKPTFKRIFAYIIDMLIVALISSLFGKIAILNPYLDEYTKYSDEYLKYVEELTEKQLLNDAELIDYSYKVAYYGVPVSIITLVVTCLYFVVFQYFNKGKTIGKAIMKIKIVSKNNNIPKFTQILLRSTIINSLLTSALLIIFIVYLSKTGYEKGSTIVQFIDIFLLLGSFGFMIIREDGKGIHDLVASTQVVNIENVKDAKIIEKEEIKHSVKKIKHKEEKTTKKKGK